MLALFPSPELKKLGVIAPSLLLASSSPNRRQLLLDCGVKTVYTFSPDADETIKSKDIKEAMEKNAGRKMKAYLSSSAFRYDIPALSADTLVEIDGCLLGKPKDKEDAVSMLSLLSGRKQKVYTGCGLYDPVKEKATYFCDEASLVFRTLTEEKILSYIESGEWKGAAGGYRLQKTGIDLVERIDGDWTTIVGLPIEKIIMILQHN